MEHILVVDDQKEVHEEIEGMLTRFGYERSHIEHAYDFQSAKNHLDNAAPDILLLDIVMPNEDGFSVVDYINKRKQKTHTIIMTAYPQLDYALKAIKSKVDAFLVKPFTELELQATLHDIIDSSQDQEEKKARSQSSHLYIRMLEEYLSGKRNDLDFQKIDYHTGLGAVIKKGSLTLLIEPLSSDQIHEKTDSVAQWLMQSGRKSLYFVCADLRVIFFIEWPEKTQEPRIREIETCLQSHFSAYHAGAAYGSQIHGLRNTYTQALFALEYADMMKLDHQIILYDLLDPGTALLQKHFSTLYAAYQSRQLSRFKETLDTLFADFMANMVEPEKAANALIEAWNIYDIDLSSIQDISSLNAMHAALLSYFEPVLRDKPAEKMPESVTRIVRYIEQHYTEPIDLNRVAGSLNLSYAYTSVLFKKHMGLSFTQYLNHFRMLKAIELLDHTHCFVYEVAKKVGFGSNKYFFKKFKEKFNMTPSEYQRQNMREKSG